MYGKQSESLRISAPLIPLTTFIVTHVVQLNPWSRVVIFTVVGREACLTGYRYALAWSQVPEESLCTCVFEAVHQSVIQINRAGSIAFSSWFNNAKEAWIIDCPYVIVESSPHVSITHLFRTSCLYINARFSEIMNEIKIFLQLIYFSRMGIRSCLIISFWSSTW